MDVTILKLQEAAKLEREKAIASEWEIYSAEEAGIFSWETEDEFNKRIEILYQNFNMFNKNVNLIEDLIKLIREKKG